MQRLPEPPQLLVPARDELADRLKELNTLLTATRWTIAAIVHAHCGPTRARAPTSAEMGRGSRSLSSRPSASVDCGKRHTVARYYYAWQWAIDAGEVPTLQVGDEIVTPVLGWPAIAPPLVEAERTVAEAAEVIAAVDPETMRLAIATSPKVADAAASALRDRRREKHRAWDAAHQPTKFVPPEPSSVVGFREIHRPDAAAWLEDAEASLRLFADGLDRGPLNAQEAAEWRDALDRLAIRIGAIRLRLGGELREERTYGPSGTMCTSRRFWRIGKRSVAKVAKRVATEVSLALLAMSATSAVALTATTGAKGLRTTEGLNSVGFLRAMTDKKLRARGLARFRWMAAKTRECLQAQQRLRLRQAPPAAPYRLTELEWQQILRDIDL